ncbi:5-formyltetrahydrofolate cyclo-ligase [Fopius arisanus]|uniref:5-formyltetrahydrofolate cyclo-ligase n=2 Tax=Fopius arisanus TaxID=64838 RepID=A0A9R1U6L1_9HYME|nr:PREDICTED: 5-formyltetrahydrofolate cyclo-ligase [Fopius arisanus]
MSTTRLAMEGIKAAKSALRKEIANIISGLSPEEKARQSTAVFQQLTKLPEYERSRRVSLYLSTEDEIDTVKILDDIFKKGKEAFVPRYVGNSMSMVKLKDMEDYEKLPLTKWNIKQPAKGDIRDDALETGGLDLVILPGVAFTKSGHRLGHGMGYYDKFLWKCFEAQEKKPHLIAVAFSEQVRNTIPINDQDVRLDLIVTEKK